MGTVNQGTNIMANEFIARNGIIALSNTTVSGSLLSSVGYIGFSDAYTGVDPTNAFQNNTISLYGQGTTHFKIGINAASEIYFKTSATTQGFAFYQGTTKANARINNSGNFEQTSGFYGFDPASVSTFDPTNATQNQTYTYYYNGANVYKTGLSALRTGKYDMYWQVGSTSGGGFRWYQGTTEFASISQAGDLLIGTTTDTAGGYKLQVASDALINTVRIGLGASNISTNTAVGVTTLNAITNGNQNTAIGFEALKSATTTSGNTALGYQALSNITTVVNTGLNTAIGYQAMSTNALIGTENVCVGYTAGKAMSYDGGSGGRYNTFVGARAGTLNTNGEQNTAIGSSALEKNLTGTKNVAIGQATLNLSTGANNTGVGSAAMEYMLGSNNTSLGYFAGRLISGGTNNTACNNSIFIGYDTRPLGLTQTNQVVIGYGTVGLGSNTVIIGNSTTSFTALQGSVSIGNNTVDTTYKLKVAGITEATQFKISALNTAPASATATGTLGEIRITSTFIYVAIATNTWVRAALTTF